MDRIPGRSQEPDVHDALPAAAGVSQRSELVAWWLERRLAVLAELACDDIVVAETEEAEIYATVLVEIAEAVRAVAPETLLFVDAVSSLGGAKIEMDAWGLDMVLTSSQKCLALPPGLALGAVSDRAMKKAETVENRGWYFDLVRMEIGRAHV